MNEHYSSPTGFDFEYDAFQPDPKKRGFNMAEKADQFEEYLNA